MMGQLVSLLLQARYVPLSMFWIGVMTCVTVAGYVHVNRSLVVALLGWRKNASRSVVLSSGSLVVGLVLFMEIRIPFGYSMMVTVILTLVCTVGLIYLTLLAGISRRRVRVAALIRDGDVVVFEHEGVAMIRMVEEVHYSEKADLMMVETSRGIIPVNDDWEYIAGWHLTKRTMPKVH